jgi:hypothetical protein
MGFELEEGLRNCFLLGRRIEKAVTLTRGLVRKVNNSNATRNDVNNAFGMLNHYQCMVDGIVSIVDDKYGSVDSVQEGKNELVREMEELRYSLDGK